MLSWMSSTPTKWSQSVLLPIVTTGIEVVQQCDTGI